MTYTVTIEAVGVTPAQIQAATARFRKALEATVGGPDQVATCFRTWGKHFDPGPKAMTEHEKQMAASYVLAEQRAEAAGNEMLLPASGKYMLCLT